MAEKTYSDLLKDPRWQKKRLEIMSRDSFACVECGNSENELHVHHKTYINGAKPWQYSDDNFLTLCSKCHKMNHHKIKIIENDGIVDIPELIKILGRFTRCVDTISNHEGSWLIELNNNDSKYNKLAFLSLLKGFAYFDDDFCVIDYNGIPLYMNSMWMFNDYELFYNYGYVVNKHSNAYIDGFDVDKFYNQNKF